MLQHEAFLRRASARQAMNKEPHALGAATFSGDGMVCSRGGDLSYDMMDDQVHQSIMAILRLSLLSSMSRSAEKEGGQEAADAFKDLVAAAAGACVATASDTGQEAVLKPFRQGSGAERVDFFFQRVLHVFLGLRERSMEDLVHWMSAKEDDAAQADAAKLTSSWRGWAG